MIPVHMQALLTWEQFMHLMRIGRFGGEKPAVRVDDDTYVDVSDVVADIDAAFLPEGLGRLRETVEERVTAGRVERFAGQRIGAPIARPHQILCIGMELGIEGLGAQRQAAQAAR